MMVAAIVLVAAASLLALVHSERTRATTAHSLAVLLALEEVSSLLKDAETSQRGYLLTDAAPYRTQYEDAAMALPARIAHLEELTRDDPAQHGRALVLSRLTGEQLASLASSLSARTVPGPGALERDLARALEASRLHEQHGFVSSFKSDRTAADLAVGAVVLGAALLLVFAIVGAWLVRQDFVARSAAEAEAARQQRRYMSLIDATCDVVWHTSPDGGMSGPQPSWSRFTGQSTEALQADGWLAAVHPDDREATWRAFELARLEAQRGGPALGVSLEHRVRRWDGELRHFKMRAMPVVESDRVIREWVGVHTDVTEQRLNESERERLIGRLGRINAELDQFAYVASHDLKAPLRGISSLSKWLEQDLGPRLTGQDQEHLRLLRDRANRLEALIDGILQYSRAGRQRSQVEQVDSERLVGETVELLAPPSTVRFETKGPLPVLRTERVPLQQVLMNLVGNALKYTRRADPVVELEARDAGRFWEFLVKDNGPGIPCEHQQRIWGIFQTLEPKDGGAGTGIGLSVVKKIVEAKGGRAWVESVLGEGACFHFTWPKQEA